MLRDLPGAGRGVTSQERDRQRNGPGRCRGRSLPSFSLSASAADATRLDDDLAAWRVDPLSYHAAIGAAVSVIFGAVVAVTISRPHAETERSDLHSGASGVRARVGLGRGRTRHAKRSSGCCGKCEFPHRVLLSFLFSVASVVNASRPGALRVREKYLSSWNHSVFCAAPSLQGVQL